MLKKIDLENLNEIFRENSGNDNSSYEFTRAPFLKEIYRVDCAEIIKTNNLMQIFTGIAYHNDFQQIPLTLDFKFGISFSEFINMPTVRLLTSIFENVRVLTKDKMFFGVWVKTLTEEAKSAYRKLLNEDKIDDSLKSIFRIDVKSNICVNPQMVKAFELVDEENLENTWDIINDKLILYLLSECNKNNGYFGIPLSSWEMDGVEKCSSFLKLKKAFNRVFLIGEGQVWKSTHLVVAEPKI